MINPALKRIYILLGVYALALLLMGITVMTPSVSSGEDFSIYNTGWNGCSGLATVAYRSFSLDPNIHLAAGEDGGLTVVQNSLTDHSMDPKSTSIMIIGPVDNFQGEECAFLRDFVTGGGTLLIADDFGSGGQLLEGMNSSLYLSGVPMDDLAFDLGPQFPVLFDPTPHPLTRNVTTLLLNLPSVITWEDEPPATIRVLLNSSSTSWLDTNGNSYPDSSETSGPFTILALERMGEGELIVLSDPSVLINSMADRHDNGRFRDDLLEYLSEGGKSVYMDESHRGNSPVLGMVASVSSQPASTKLVVLSVLTLTFGLVIMDPMSLIRWGSGKVPMSSIGNRLHAMVSRGGPGPHTPTSGEVKRLVMRRHPDWDERVLGEILQHLA